MKKVIFIFQLLFIGLIGCTSDDIGINNPVPPPKVEFSKKGILWPGNQRVIDILTNGSFTIDSLESEIATVKMISEKQFLLKGISPGKTSTTIKDKHGNITVYNIHVMVLDGNWVDTGKNEVYVEISNNKLKESIIKAIQTSESTKVKSIYSFNWVSKTVKYIPSSFGDHASFNGTYSCSDFSLIIQHGVTENIYQIKTDPDNEKLVEISEDLTDIYRKLYPYENINSVVLSKYIGMLHLDGV